MKNEDELFNVSIHAKIITWDSYKILNLNRNDVEYLKRLIKVDCENEAYELLCEFAASRGSSSDCFLNNNTPIKADYNSASIELHVIGNNKFESYSNKKLKKIKK